MIRMQISIHRFQRINRRDSPNKKNEEKTASWLDNIILDIFAQLEHKIKHISFFEDREKNEY